MVIILTEVELTIAQITAVKRFITEGSFNVFLEKNFKEEQFLIMTHG